MEPSTPTPSSLSNPLTLSVPEMHSSAHSWPNWPTRNPSKPAWPAGQGWAHLSARYPVTGRARWTGATTPALTRNPMSVDDGASPWVIPNEIQRSADTTLPMSRFRPPSNLMSDHLRSSEDIRLHSGITLDLTTETFKGTLETYPLSHLLPRRGRL